MNVIPFAFEANAVRVIEDAGTLWFVASDIAKTLGYRDSHNLCRRLQDKEKRTHSVSTLGGTQGLTVINESGLYHAIIKSRLPVAEKFREWVTAEVLPSIRKSGTYGVKGGESSPTLNNSDLGRLVETLQEAVKQNAQLIALLCSRQEAAPEPVRVETIDLSLCKVKHREAVLLEAMKSVPLWIGTASAKYNLTRKAVASVVLKLRYSGFNIRTVTGLEDTCYELVP